MGTSAEKQQAWFDAMTPEEQEEFLSYPEDFQREAAILNTGGDFGDLKKTWPKPDWGERIKGAAPEFGATVGFMLGGPQGAAVGSSIGDATAGSGDAEDAAEAAAATQERSYGQGIDEQRRQFDATQENLAPWLEAGESALSTQQNLLGLSGKDAQQKAYDDYSMSPGQKFLRDRGEKAIIRQHMAIGGAGGGRVRSALNRQGIGFAAQDFGNYYNRLAGVSGTGQTTATGLGRLGANAATNISNLYGLQGNARASGILGSQQERSKGMSNIMGLASMLYGGMGGDDGGLTADTANQIQSYDFSGY